MYVQFSSDRCHMQLPHRTVIPVKGIYDTESDCNSGVR